jgi:MOSC domain-containing protein YiiM
VEEVRAIIGHGLDGDVHGKRSPDSSRQVLLVDRRTLEALGFAPGALREQLTVDLAGLEALPRGTRLRIGEAILELTVSCEPCEVIGKYNDAADPYALRERLRGQRGMMSRVVATTGEGLIRRGDPIVVEAVQADQAAAGR